MLDTLLAIGKILRESKRLRHHRYIKRAPQSDKKTEVVYFSLSVREDFSFDLENIFQISDEDFIKHELFYLTYKSSDADSLMKYLWGDVAYGVIKDKEQGYYRMENAEIKNAFGLSSFVRGIEDAKKFNGTHIGRFRKSYDENGEFIESFLKENGKEKICYLHFDFQGKHWYQFDEELNAVNNKLLDDFVKPQKDKFVLRKSLYKTLASPEKNLPFPHFTAEAIYKTKTFETSEEILDLLYAINYSTKAIISERDIKIIVLPKAGEGRKLKPDEIEDFFERKRLEKSSASQKLENEIAEEVKLEPVEQSNDINEFFDSLFAPTLIEVAGSINSYDFIFSKSGGVSAPDVDMIELAGVERSHLAQVAFRVGEIRKTVQDKRDALIKSDKLGALDIRRSFLNILGDVTKDKKKYQSHLLKVLPQIYSGTYGKDDLLLPAFIEKSEYNIRNETLNYNLLKFDYEFLTRLRGNKTNPVGDKEMENVFESPSFKAGKLLGQMAQPVSWEIKSFEKNYVGLLSRRISDVDSLMDFAGFICEKLAIHERAYPSLKQKYAEFISEVKELRQSYDRRYLAVGFFEGYYAKFEKPEKHIELTETPEQLTEERR